uniref:Uncharacterized protein n=1 Tax=Avena sativa TaxID=4498 RepID=A0ACD5UVH5_AVESA
MLRENRDMFDLVISDVHMPFMDGFQLLEHVGVEMDLPVIMLSVNGETKSVMKGITSGACDYLLKPVRIEELKNIWQHVLRRRRKFSTNPDNVHGQVTYDQSERPNNKRKEYDSVDEDENGDSSDQKRPRIVWSVEMHMKFVTAVIQLGVNKAVPRRILELMDVKNLTRENVASHLQKYRLHLRWLDALKSQQFGIYAALGGRDPFLCMNAFLRLQGYYQAITSPPALSSFSAQGLLHNVSNENQSAVVAQAVSVQTVGGSCTDANMYSHLSLSGNQHANLAQGLVPSLGQVQLQQKWMSADSGDLSAIVTGNSLATGTVQSVIPSSPLLPQDLAECTQANVAIQPSIRVPSAGLELLEDVVGSSFGMFESPVSQQSPHRLPGHGSFNSNGSTRLANESSANSLIGPKVAKSSSQLLSTVGAQHSIDQRSTNYCSMFAQTSAGATPVVPQTKIDVLFSGDTWTPRNASEPSIPSLLSELSSSTCSLDSLLDSMIKFKVDNGDSASGDDLWCDFYPPGACI